MNVHKCSQENPQFGDNLTFMLAHLTTCKNKLWFKLIYCNVKYLVPLNFLECALIKLNDNAISKYSTVEVKLLRMHHLKLPFGLINILNE